MIKYSDSDIFKRMNLNDGLTKKITEVVKATNNKTIVNHLISDSLKSMNAVYRETITSMAIDAIKKNDVFIVVMPIDTRLPANMPYVTVDLQGRKRAIVDVSKYAKVERDTEGAISKVDIDPVKLFNLLIPAYVATNSTNFTTKMPTVTLKYFAIMWARMFNKVLISQKIFVGNKDRYNAFMYFAIKFFILYYAQSPEIIAENIALEYIGSKSEYLAFIEEQIKHKNINMYEDWTTFARTMFSNEITNIKIKSFEDINVEQYLRMFTGTMGRDGAYMALWSVDYFFYCIFITFNKAYILNDRNWEDIVQYDRKTMNRLLISLYGQIKA